MPQITEDYIDELERRYGLTPEINELRRRYGLGGFETFTPAAIPDPTAVSAKSMNERVSKEYDIAAQHGISLGEAREVLLRQETRGGVVGHFKHGWYKTAIGLANVPASLARLLERADEDPSFPFFAGISNWRGPEDIPTPISDFLQKGTDWLTKDAEDYVKRHPEWRGEPAESFVDLITDPKKLSEAIAESIPMLIGAGLMTASGHPIGAFSIAYAAEGQDAYDEALADTGDRNIAHLARISYGLPAAAIEFAQLSLGLKMTKEFYRAALGRIGWRLGQEITKKGGRKIVKDFLLTLIEENVQEWIQGDWQAATMTMLYDKPFVEGGFLGWLDRHAMESAVISPLVTAAGGAGAAVGFAGRAGRAAALKELGAPPKPTEAKPEAVTGAKPTGEIAYPEYPEAEVLKFMTPKEQVKAREVAKAEDSAMGSMKEFIMAFGEDIFDAKTGKPIEIGGNVILTKPLRAKPTPAVERPTPAEAVKQGKPVPRQVPRQVLQEYKTEKWAQEALVEGEEGKAFREKIGAEKPPAVPPTAPPTAEAVPSEPGDIGKVVAEQLKEAKKMIPQVAFEKSKELGKRVGAMVGTKESLIKKGIPAKEAIQRSVGQLAGRLTDYELRYDSVELSPKMEEAAYRSIAESDKITPLGIEPTANAFEKLLAGSYITWGEALLLQEHFGADLGKEARRRVPLSKKWLKLLPSYLGIWRTLLTAATGDLSGIGRQGVGAGVAFPALFAKFAKEYGKAWASEDLAKKLNTLVMESPWLKEALSGKVKLELLKRGPGVIEPIERAEELLAAEPLIKLAEIKIKGVKIGKIFYPISQLTRMSERGFVESLNYFRMSIYDAIRTAQQETLKQMSEEERAKHEHLFNSREAADRIKSLINDATGRAWIRRTGAMKGLVPILSAAFAPRFVISRFRAPIRVAVEVARAGKRTAKGEPVNWAELRLTAGAMAGLAILVTTVGTAIAAAARMWGYDEDEVSFEYDLRSVNWGRLTIRNMRIDLAGGYQTSLRIAAQLMSGQTKTQAGEIIDMKLGDRQELFLRELRKKSRPITSLVLDAWTGRTFWGEKFGAPPKGKEKDVLDAIGMPENMQGVTKEFWQRTMGLAVQDLVDAYVIEGVPEGIVAGILANLGVGVQTYERWASSELIERENRLAKAKFSKKWDELKPSEQQTLEPKLEKLRVKVGQEMTTRARSKYVTREEEKVREKFWNALPETAKKKLSGDEIGMTHVGHVGRWWTDNFRLSDKRYKEYQECAVPLVRDAIRKELVSYSFRRLETPSRRREALWKVITEAKEAAREKLKEDIEKELL